MKASKLQLFYLSCLSMIGFIATDIYLPGFKAIEQSLNTGPEQVALSLTVFLVGLAAGQLIWGIISDRIGHKKALIYGLAIFTIASFGLSFTQTVWQLLSLRLLQAIGVCAPSVIWQAMTVNKYPEKESQHIFGVVMPLVALSPAIAPQIGAAVLNSWGWHAIFVLMAIFGLCLLLATLTQTDTHVKPTIKATPLKDIAKLFKSRVFVSNVAIYSFTCSAFFSYLTGLPEIMSSLGYSAQQIGQSFVPQTIMFIVGGYTGKLCVQRFGDSVVLKGLVALFMTSGLCVFIATQSNLSSIWPLLISFSFLAAANGAIYPVVVNRALGSAKDCAATAAGLQNSLQICISSLFSALVAAFASQALAATGVAILICLICVGIAYAVLRTTETAANQA